MNIFVTTVALSVELPDERVVPMGRRKNAGKPDEVPVVVGYADEEEDEDDEEDQDEEEDDEEDE